jgi:2-C-methyl-D-erythritol 4-phosphate cytidylyltransferase
MKDLVIKAIVVAAGKGKRFGSKLPKQFLKLNKFPVLFYPLKILSKSPFIKEIFLAVDPDWINYCKENILKRYGLLGKIVLLEGGRHRQDSVFNALKQVHSADLVLIQDGVRPFINQQMIKEVLMEALKLGGSVFGTKAKDTLKLVSEEGVVEKTLNRERVWYIQTPQAFRFKELLISYQAAYEEGFWGTDCASLFERFGYKVKVILGPYENIKITDEVDFELAKKIFHKFYTEDDFK